jgi:hypothetical protein
MDYAAKHNDGASLEQPMFTWPTGPWTLWVDDSGHLHVTGPGEPQPERSAFPVAGAASRREACACRLLLGHRRPGGSEILIDAFGGRIADVIELQQLLGRRRPGRGA